MPPCVCVCMFVCMYVCMYVGLYMHVCMYAATPIPHFKKSPPFFGFFAAPPPFLAAAFFVAAGVCFFYMSAPIAMQEVCLLGVYMEMYMCDTSIQTHRSTSPIINIKKSCRAISNAPCGSCITLLNFLLILWLLILWHHLLNSNSILMFYTLMSFTHKGHCLLLRRHVHVVGTSHYQGEPPI